ncbi:MAG: ABC transporter permease [Planctomycetota bacterium]|jgi:ribose transport system permease protein|nr:ABC transporter permease [Planctomycetota bacterium]
MPINRLIAYIKGPGQQKAIALAALAALYTFFCIFGSHFASRETLISIFDSSYYTGFMAIGMTLVIISAGIDLSVGTVTVGSALVGGVAYTVWHLPMGVALVVIVLTGTLFGLINGLLIGKLDLPPFIATLGSQFISMGLCSVVARVQTMRYPSISHPDGWFKTVFFKTVSGFPMGALWVLLFFVITVILLTYTKLGNYTYAIGDNEEAVRLSGINIANWKVVIYTISGFFSGLAGIIYAATFSSITPQTGGGLEMYAIAACVIGGASLAGGVGSLTGTLIGVLVISVLKNGLMSMWLPVQWQQFFIGLVVLAAVLVDVIRSKKAHNAK